MKPKPYFRIIFAVLVLGGSLLFLQGARKVAAENINRAKSICKSCNMQDNGSSITEFIFFESVTKYLVVSLVR